MDTENKDIEQTIYKIVTVKRDDKGKKRYCFQIPFISFWISIMTVCVAIGCVCGLLLYGMNLLVKLGEDAVEESKRYSELQEEYEQHQNSYKELEVKLEDLDAQIIVLGDTIAQNKADAESMQQQKELEATPTGFPVTGTVVDAETPEEAIAFEPAIYLEGSDGAVVVATGTGVVTQISVNAYGDTEIYVDHENGFKSVYINGSTALISQEMRVSKGTPLFLIEHDHTLIKYQITLDDALVDPYSVMVIEG